MPTRAIYVTLCKPAVERVYAETPERCTPSAIDGSATIVRTIARAALSFRFDRMSGFRLFREQCFNEHLGFEVTQVVDFFAESNEFYRQFEIARNAENDAAFGAAIQLSQNDAS